MTYEIMMNLLGAVLFALVGGVVGVGMVFLAARLLPKALNRLTPVIDEEREIARGNLAVAQYFGRVVAAAIIGVSIVVAAAVLGGLLAGLHGTEIIVPPTATAPR